MNQSQIKYARERADRIKRSRLSALRSKFGPKTLTTEERVSALLGGRFRVIEDAKGSSYYIGDLIQFEDETPKDDAAIYEATQQIEAEFSLLLDKLILGDAEDALVALQKFEAGE